jgi:hypothetical protein
MSASSRSDAEAVAQSLIDTNRFMGLMGFMAALAFGLAVATATSGAGIAAGMFVGIGTLTVCVLLGELAKAIVIAVVMDKP